MCVRAAGVEAVRFAPGSRHGFRGAAVFALGLMFLASACDAPKPAVTSQEAQRAAKEPPAKQVDAAPAPAVAKEAPREEPPVVVTKTPSVVTASATVEPSEPRVGQTFTVRIDVQIGNDWHIYAIDRPTGPSVPTSIEFELPKPLEWVGEWKGPEPTLDEAHPEEPSFIYQGAVKFQRQVRVAGTAAPGPITLQGSLHYQACNKVSCRAPTQLALQAELKLVP
jgi:hypothetical protein